MKMKKQNPGRLAGVSRDQLGGWSHNASTSAGLLAQTRGCLSCQACLTALCMGSSCCREAGHE